MPTLGRYAIERRIASGGMASVYMARMMGAYGFEKRVALKLLKREVAEDQEHVRMFVREALVAAEFRHPNLAQVYEVGEESGQLYIAMELVRGLSLASLLRALAEQGGGMPLNVMLRIATDALDGLANAHEARDANDQALGLVHRDVSPQNLMVGVDGVTKVVDFGIARAEAAFGKTIVPRVKGKFSYMAPEQWQASSSLDARADLWAMGVVLYECTTGGTKLFRADNPKELFRAVMQDAIPPPSSRIANYPPSLEAVVMKALVRDPDERYPTARAMRDALLDVARTERWALGNKVVAELIRNCIGTKEIETLWPPVGEHEQLEELVGNVNLGEVQEEATQRNEQTVAIPLAMEKALSVGKLSASVVASSPAQSAESSELAPAAVVQVMPSAAKWPVFLAGLCVGLALGAISMVLLTH